MSSILASTVFTSCSLDHHRNRLLLTSGSRYLYCDQSSLSEWKAFGPQMRMYDVRLWSLRVQDLSRERCKRKGSASHVHLMPDRWLASYQYDRGAYIEYVSSDPNVSCLKVWCRSIHSSFRYWVPGLDFGKPALHWYASTLSDFFICFSSFRQIMTCRARSGSLPFRGWLWPSCNSRLSRYEPDSHCEVTNLTWWLRVQGSCSLH